MYGDGFYVMEDRVLREQDLAERMAERRRQALAVTVDKGETWSAVWERLEAKGRL